MSKRQHHELIIDVESSTPLAKRLSPLNAEESDPKALKDLENLSAYLGLGDLTHEDTNGMFLATSFVGTVKIQFIASN
jgi:hypothetical protein